MTKRETPNREAWIMDELGKLDQKLFETLTAIKMLVDSPSPLVIQKYVLDGIPDLKEQVRKLVELEFVTVLTGAHFTAELTGNQEVLTDFMNGTLALTKPVDRVMSNPELVIKLRNKTKE